MAKRFTEKATLLEGEKIIEEMMNGTFVSDTVPINIAHEVET